MTKPSLVPADSRYVPLTQQRWCCVPTCIQMVMLRHTIPLLPQEQIGYEMGLIVPDEGLQYFWNMRTGERPPAGYGTQIGKPEYGPNAVFKRLKIPLTMSWKLINSFSSSNEIADYLKMIQEHDGDVLVCFDWPTLYDKTCEDHWGHVCVFDVIDVKTNMVRIIDPGPDVPKWKTVSVDELYEAMRIHTKDKSGGFWQLLPRVR